MTYGSLKFSDFVLSCNLFLLLFHLILCYLCCFFRVKEKLNVTPPAVHLLSSQLNKYNRRLTSLLLHEPITLPFAKQVWIAVMSVLFFRVHVHKRR